MKTTISHRTISLIILFSMILFISSKKHRQTPKALDLTNHYGSQTVEHAYGPHSNAYAKHVENNLETFAPFLNKSHKQISPEIAGPKMRVSGHVEYPVHSKVPTFLGYKNEFQPVEAYDRQEGKLY